MKDVQGIQRGKCNHCECEEYRPPPESGKFSCEYCGHRPTEHVRIVELGRCRTKGCDCDKYSPEEPNNYSDCEYCGCKPSAHEGAEALRKKQPPQQAAPQYPTQPATVPMMAMADQMTMMGQQPVTMAQPSQAGIQPRKSATGAPAQTMSHGTCSFPGCPFPKRQEGGKVHPYCSRTCAQKMQSSFHAQKIASATQAAKGTPQAAPPGALAGQPPTQQQQQLPQQPQLTAMCKKCTVNPANPGRSWCESCFRQQQLQKP